MPSKCGMEEERRAKAPSQAALSAQKYQSFPRLLQKPEPFDVRHVVILCAHFFSMQNAVSLREWVENKLSRLFNIDLYISRTTRNSAPGLVSSTSQIPPSS